LLSKFLWLCGDRSRNELNSKEITQNSRSQQSQILSAIEIFMLESFEITNFRLFQHLQVKKLSRVNLIVGKNNSGKSSFLEALELYVSNASPIVLLELLESRQDDWSSKASSHSQVLFNSPLRHLFFAHKLPESKEWDISLGEIPLTKLFIGVTAYQYLKDEDMNYSSVLHLDFQQAKDSSDYEIFLVSKEREKNTKLFRLDYALNDTRYNPRLLIERQKNTYMLQKVLTSNMPNKKLSALWDLTSLDAELKSEVIEALCLIDKRVTGVGFVDDTTEKHDRIPLVTMEGVKEPLPLKSMGDGMMRLFHIILALVNAKNGILLIDEFENGLHWSVQPKVWNVVFQVAEKLNVQVFATTHSRDCIAGFDEAWNTYPELGAFLRLDLKDGTVKATEYTSETLNDSLEMDVEVR
jgi:AAA15 family ATPase/GTPase